MAGLQPGERVPYFRRHDQENNPQVLYELHYGQPILLAVLPDDVADVNPELLDELNRDHAVWRKVSRIALRNGLPRDCARFVERHPLSFPLLADDGAVTEFLTGHKRQEQSTFFFLDNNLRLVQRIETDSGAQLAKRVAKVLDSLPNPEPVVIRQPAPVLILPRVLEPAFCDELIELFERDGGHESGVLYLEGNTQRWAPDPGTKIRRDVYLQDDKVQNRIRDIVGRRVLPEIDRCFNYQVTRHEPFKLVRYGGEKAGYFRPHRDNVTRDAAHRRFAMTINLNDPDGYQGGQLRFPEHGPHLYQPPRGGAIVFSCSLVHEAVDVTRGYRYALLGFFYNEQSIQTGNNPR